MTKLRAIIMYLFLHISGQISHVKKTVKCKHVWYGNTYGGFYACPDFLNKDSIVYSFGIGEDISFDQSIIKNHNCLVYGFDPTPKSIHWIKSQQLPETFHFFEFGISTKSGLSDFYLPKNPEYVSGSIILHKNINTKEIVKVKFKTIEDIVRELDHHHIDILKMDIEGAEYEVLENILNAKISITQILIEFHGRFFKNGKIKTKEAILNLKSHGFEIFAISDSYEEISFINKDVLKQQTNR